MHNKAHCYWYWHCYAAWVWSSANVVHNTRSVPGGFGPCTIDFLGLGQFAPASPLLGACVGRIMRFFRLPAPQAGIYARPGSRCGVATLISPAPLVTRSSMLGEAPIDATHLAAQCALHAHHSTMLGAVHRVGAMGSYTHGQVLPWMCQSPKHECIARCTCVCVCVCVCWQGE